MIHKHKMVLLPKSLKDALHSSHLLEAFHGQPFADRKKFVQLIESAKRPEIRRVHIIKIIAALKSKV